MHALYPEHRTRTCWFIQSPPHQQRESIIRHFPFDMYKRWPNDTRLLDRADRAVYCIAQKEPVFWMCSTASNRYPTNTFGFSVAGKCPKPFIAWCLPPLILSQVFWPISGVLDPRGTWSAHWSTPRRVERIRTVILPRQHVDWALLGIDAGHAAATVPAAKVPLRCQYHHFARIVIPVLTYQDHHGKYHTLAQSTHAR